MPNACAGAHSSFSIRHLAFGIGLLLLPACGSAPQPGGAPRAAADPAPASTPAAAAADERTAAPVFPLRVQGTGFVDSRGEPWSWRGITSFRLAEMLAAGGEPDVLRYLDWAAAQDLTVVRVLLMAEHLFTLAPEAGREALPRLLDLARERGLAVEVVALADTLGRNLDLEAHVREVGRIAREKGNAFVELANEPGHPTQDPRLHDPATLKRLFERLPADLVVALGSAEYDPAYATADYATYHFPREPAWKHVLALAEGADMLARWQKPVINDEPIGCAAAYREGRRDNVPERFGAAAALGRFVGLGATFHYEGGLQARLPDEEEATCLDAWLKGLALVRELPVDRQLLDAAALSAIAQVTGARAVFASTSGPTAAILLVDPSSDAQVTWRDGWRAVRRASAPGTQLLTAATR